MPISPFMGVSVILHVLIIAFFWLRNYLAPKYETRATRRYRKNVSYFMSSCIALFIFSIVLASGYSLIASSIANEHSSIKIAGTYLDEYDTGHFADEIIVPIEGAARFVYVHAQSIVSDFFESFDKTEKI